MYSVDYHRPSAQNRNAIIIVVVIIIIIVIVIKQAGKTPACIHIELQDFIHVEFKHQSQFYPFQTNPETATTATSACCFASTASRSRNRVTEFCVSCESESTEFKRATACLPRHLCHSSARVGVVGQAGKAQQQLRRL